MGDFNYPEIDFQLETVQAETNASPTRFFDKTQELCLIQSVIQPTRVRQNQQPSVLDYVFMEEDNLVDELKYSAPLGKSDHVILEWNSALRTGDINSEQVKLNYWKGNYREINAALEKIDWTQMFEGRLVEEMWTLFKRAVLEQVALHVPVKEQRRKKKGKWLSRETIKRMKQRDIAWRKL